MSQRLTMALLLPLAACSSDFDSGLERGKQTWIRDDSAGDEDSEEEDDSTETEDTEDTGTGVRGGPVRLSEGVLIDDGGPFVALGSTMMWAAWAYRNDRARLEENLSYLSENGFDYIRALGVVGDPEADDYWDGREIDPDWPDYTEVIAGLTDLAWDSHGLRVEWTLIGDGQITVPSWIDKVALADRFLEMSRGREEKILHFEVANEAWQNGFPDGEGNAELRELTTYLRDRTEILVAASAPAGTSCSDWLAVYAGDVADLATLHFDRDISTVEGDWRPVRLPWDVQSCSGLPTASNNEPIGPGSSGASEDDPLRLVIAAATTWISGLPLYVLHSHAGVRGDENLWEESGFDDFSFVHEIMGGDTPGLPRSTVGDESLPFVVWAGDRSGGLHPDAVWTDLADPAWGALRVYGVRDGDDFLVVLFGVLGSVRIEARQAMGGTLYDPTSGAVLGTYTLTAGETFDLSGQEAWIFTGTLI